MTHRGPFQPLLFCDSVIPRGLAGDAPSVLRIRSLCSQLSFHLPPYQLSEQASCRGFLPHCQPCRCSEARAGPGCSGR